MTALHHPNIVQFLGYATNPSSTLVIELFEAVEFVEREAGQKTSRRFCIDMALAIEYLHGRQPSIVIHKVLTQRLFLNFKVRIDARVAATRRRGRMASRRGGLATASFDTGT